MRTDAQVFDDIGEALTRTAPAGWLSLRLDGSIFDDWGRVRLYATHGSGVEERYDGGSETHDRLFVLLSELRGMMTVASHPAWNRMRLNLDNDGKLRADFEHIENWEADIFKSL